MTYTKNGVILILLLLIENITMELRKASTLLTNGLHFPFKIQNANWQTMQKYVMISTHYDYPSIYIILRFPIVVYPMYKIIKILLLLVHTNANVLH